MLANEIDDFNQYKMLRKGYALLTYYLDGGILMEKFWFDKLLGNNDRQELASSGWTSEQTDYAIGALCNTVAISIPTRRKNMEDKFAYFRKENLVHPADSFFNSSRSYLDFDIYECHVKNMLNRFFADKTWKDWD